MPNFTIENLLLYLYGEMDNKQKDALDKELMSNWALRQKLQVLSEAKNRLENIKKVSPRRQTIDALMEHAGATSKVSS